MRTAIQHYSNGKFEFFLVAIVVAIVVSIAGKRYSDVARDAQILRLQVISQHFATAAVNARIEFLLRRVAQNSAAVGSTAEQDGANKLSSDDAAQKNRVIVAESPPEPSEQYFLRIDDTHLYVTEQGWPASVTRPAGKDFRPSDADCRQLWMLLLQNPAPISQGQFTSSKHEFRTYAVGALCRYALVEESAYFDYFPQSGRTRFNQEVSAAAK